MYEKEIKIIIQLFQFFGLTLGAAPSTDVAGIVVGQNLTRGRQSTKLDVVVENSIRGQTQESNVPPESQTSRHS